MDLDAFAEQIGTEGPVTITGAATRGGPVPGVRTVGAPSGIVELLPEETIVRCGAGTPVDELLAELATHGQTVAVPPGGTVGGALAVGRSAVTRLGHGPLRDGVLQLRAVMASGELVKAGGPTVKNVSGFDLCRLLVGSHGSLGFLAEVILRTRPCPARACWYAGESDPFALHARLYRPSAILWDGTTTWVLLEGHPDDVAAQASLLGLPEVDGPPALPTGGRESLNPGDLRGLTGRFVAEIGVGVVHRAEPASARPAAPTVVELHRRLKAAFDPGGRLNPGREPLTAS